MLRACDRGRSSQIESVAVIIPCKEASVGQLLMRMCGAADTEIGLYEVARLGEFVVHARAWVK